MWWEALKAIFILVGIVTIIIIVIRKYPKTAPICVFIFLTLICGSVFLLFFIIMFAPNPSDQYIYENYKYLIPRFDRAYRQRIIDDGDEMPDIYCVENKTSILKVLGDKELISEMINGLSLSRLPCVSSYHFTKINQTMMPKFLLLRKRYNRLNWIGNSIRVVSNLLGIKDSYYIKLFSRIYGVDYHEGEYYYIFNPKRIGGSKKRESKIKRYTSLYRWKNTQETFLRRFSVQVDCVEAAFYKSNIHINPSILTFRGELAYCLQDFWLDIKDHEMESDKCDYFY